MLWWLETGWPLVGNCMGVDRKRIQRHFFLDRLNVHVILLLLPCNCIISRKSILNICMTWSLEMLSVAGHLHALKPVPQVEAKATFWSCPEDIEYSGVSCFLEITDDCIMAPNSNGVLDSLTWIFLDFIVDSLPKHQILSTVTLIRIKS